MARFKGTTKDEFIDNQRTTGNIYTLLDTAMSFFFKHLSLSGKVEGLYREEELEIPYKALRECCTNALCHRSYHRPGSSVGIAIYDDRVEIENSGTFPPDITMEKLLSGHNSEPQNLIIANVLYKSEVLESWVENPLKVAPLIQSNLTPVKFFHSFILFILIFFVFFLSVMPGSTLNFVYKYNDSFLLLHLRSDSPKSSIRIA